MLARRGGALIPEFRRQEDLHDFEASLIWSSSEFQGSESDIVKPCLKKLKNKMLQILRGNKKSTVKQDLDGKCKTLDSSM